VQFVAPGVPRAPGPRSARMVAPRLPEAPSLCAAATAAVVLAAGAASLSLAAPRGLERLGGTLRQAEPAAQSKAARAQAGDHVDGVVAPISKAAPLVVISGPPAAGKGTQCARIKAKYGYVHVSVGNILRENVRSGTALGIEAKRYMDRGDLVPNELILDVVENRLARPDVQERGCLLDGFPRTANQARALLDAGFRVDRFILLRVPDDMLVERGCGRRLDPVTGDIYHMSFKPPPEDITDRLVHRSDDTEGAIRKRLGHYHAQVESILPFFQDVVVQVDGTKAPDDVFTSVSTCLDDL